MDDFEDLERAARRRGGPWPCLLFAVVVGVGAFYAGRWQGGAVPGGPGGPASRAGVADGEFVIASNQSAAVMFTRAPRKMRLRDGRASFQVTLLGEGGTPIDTPWAEYEARGGTLYIRDLERGDLACAVLSPDMLECDWPMLGKTRYRRI